MRVGIWKDKKKEGLNEVWWEIGEVIREYSYLKHFSDNKFFFFFFFFLAF